VLLESERRLIVSCGRRLAADGLVTGTYGNLSVRHGRYVAITPTSFPYESLTPALICVVDLSGHQLEGPLAPSIELPTHVAIHRRRGNGAIVHSHAPCATALSAAPDSGPPLAPTAPRARPGSQRLAAAVVSALGNGDAVLLAGHGTVTTGRTLGAAYARTLSLERAAREQLADAA
jgi:L-fuculose-phosphate aldolase